MNFTQTEQYDSVVNGHLGRPEDYPDIPPSTELLFYIQRNQNTNTVIYEANLSQGGLLNLNEPIKISWLKFRKDGKNEIQDLNDIQKKLAYGYHFKIISQDLIEFCFVSYKSMKFYLFKDGDTKYRVSAKVNDVLSIVEKIYIFAEDMGIFPQVKFAELFCKTQKNRIPIYKKLLFQ